MLLAICIIILVGGIVWYCCDEWSDGAFARLAMIQFKMEPLLNDLRKNWHVGHAHTFMKGMKIISQKLGFKCPEFEEGENGEV